MTRYEHPVLPDMADAACREYDPELFFPEQQLQLVIAREVCAGCAALPACQEAVEARVAATSWYGLWGVWAGVFYRNGEVIDQIRPPGRPATGGA